MAKRTGLTFGKQRRKFNFPLFKEVISWIAEIIIVIVIAGVLVYFFGMRTGVVGTAMEPTLTGEDQVLVNQFIYSASHPKKMDVIIFLPNGNEKSHYYVRRVIGTPGDKIQIKNGAVYVNGKLFEDISAAPIEDAGIASEEITVGNGEYFVLGDNRNNSEDSRYANIGNVKEEYIIGKAWFYFSSWERKGFIK